MKTYLSYGLYMSLGNALLVFALYFLGFHSEAAKLSTAQNIQMVAGLALGITFIVLGTKERRAAVPASEGFGYGSALGAGVMIGLFAALFGTVFTYLYAAVINPNFIEVMLQAQTDKLELQGLSGDKIEQINAMTRGMMKPPIQAAFGFVFGLLFSTLISLVSAAFLKRAATDEVVAA
jgi:hypothetical protein